MYRNVTYSVKNNQGVIRLDTWDDNGEPVTKHLKHNSHLYYEDANGSDLSIFRTKLQRKNFPSSYSRRQWIKKHPKMKLYESLTPIREFLVEYYEKDRTNESFSKNELNVCTFDIEIAVDANGSFPKSDEAAYPVNVMSFHLSVPNEVHVFYLGEIDMNAALKEHDGVAIVYHNFDSEKKMFKSFINWFRSSKIDVLTGWNIELFDIPYIINRMKSILPMQYNMLSPINSIKTVNKDYYGSAATLETYIIEGCAIIDYIVLYKNKFVIKQQFYTLDHICQVELGTSKLDHSEFDSFYDFYTKDFNKYVKYNIIDTIRVVQLEQKMELLKLSRAICYYGLCELEGILKSASYITGAVALKARDEGMRLISDNKVDATKGEKYEGAFVKDTIPGFYKNGIASIDFNSLYPNVMITCNISPETKFGKIIEVNDNDVVIRLTAGNTKVLSKAELHKALKTTLIIASNKVLYYKHAVREGVIPKFLSELYGDRVAVKNEIKRLKATGDKSQKAMDKLATLDRDQFIKKIFLNSTYGQMGNKYSCLFDIDNAEAITLTGQFLIKGAMDYIDDEMPKAFGFDNWDEKCVIAGDTDSVLFDINCIVSSILGKPKQKSIEWNEELIASTIKAVDKYVPIVNAHCAHLIKAKLCSNVDTIEFAREKFSTLASFYKKKRYVIYVVDDEGTRTNKFFYRGIQVRKHELPESVKNVLKYLIESSMLESWQNEKYQAENEIIWDKFKATPVNELAYIRNYNSNKDPIGFLNTAKGSTITNRAVVYYNQLIEKLNIKHKYEAINVSDRIRYVYIKPSNQYGINVIAFKDKWPKEFNSIFECDYPLMFEKIISKSLSDLEAVHNFAKFNPGRQVMQSVLDL